MLDLTTLQIAVALFAALGAAFVRGLAGFGMAILLVPVLGLAIPPREAVVVANWLGLLIGFVGLKRIIQDSERSALTIAVIAVLATPLGVMLLAWADPALARVLIALIALGSFVLVLLPKRPADHVPTALETGTTGLLSGVLTGFAGMPGPPVVPYYLRRAIPPQLARASMMAIFMATSLAGVIAASVLKVATVREPLLALLLFPGVLLGNHLGHKAFGKVSDTAWRSFTGLVLGLSAVAALWRLMGS
ncbi:sulfite exporter TauE/SafE family protein [Novosphingobium sp. B 225]|uniref:sulfite exporter TauE/SafE family protein n=1 Tax=Novosphingobium sp. B 225 TaxID=1961849 RepID=UPI000B4B9C37|nr:sulfite exporter TauE/SafE family protein [Novosphingobium sp. B 225]